MAPDSPANLSDDEVIASVLAGHTQNFAVLIERYGKKIVNFINRMIQDWDEAQSLSQEAFLKVFEYLRYYRGQNNFSAFIFKIAKNLTINHIKRQKRLVFFSRLLGKEMQGDDFAEPDSPETAVADSQQESLLEAGLAALGEEQRLALILKVYLDFSYKQIADVTGWSTPKIETLISRAKSALKKKINMQETTSQVVSQARKR